MSQQAMKTVIQRAANDANFRKLLLTSPDQALSGYELTQTEIDNIKSMDEATLSTASFSQPGGTRSAV